MAFFPCIYFESVQMLYFCLESRNIAAYPMTERIDAAIDRLEKRTAFHKLLYQLLWVAYDKRLRLIIENPAGGPTYLIHGQNFPAPSLIDQNRLARGDYYKKPTAYWYVNCNPTNGWTEQRDKKPRQIKRAKRPPVAGLCSEERSMISPDYARNFICDFIFGKPQINTQLKLFE